MEALRPFFTETLEFIFIAAELCDCGWDYQSWTQRAGNGKFKEYTSNYNHSLARLKAALAENAARKAASKRRGTSKKTSSRRR